MLTVQYRMHPEIRAFPSDTFYGGRLTDAPCVRPSPAGKSSGPPSPSPSPSPGAQSQQPLPLPAPHPTAVPQLPLVPCTPPFLFLDVSAGRDRRVGNSYDNPEEALFASALLRHLNGRLDHSSGGEGRGSVGGGAQTLRVGVITPYRGQVRLIQQQVRELGLGQSLPPLGSTGFGAGVGRHQGGNSSGLDIKVSTVDGFQGRECDVVIFSCVRAPSDGGGIGFLADRRRMNVALTRAKRSLVVLGNARRLAAAATVVRRPPRSSSSPSPSSIAGLTPPNRDSGAWKALVAHAAAKGRLMDTRGETREVVCARLEAGAVVGAGIQTADEGEPVILQAISKPGRAGKLRSLGNRQARGKEEEEGRKERSKETGHNGDSRRKATQIDGGRGESRGSVGAASAPADTDVLRSANRGARSMCDSLNQPGKGSRGKRDKPVKYGGTESGTGGRGGRKRNRDESPPPRGHSSRKGYSSLGNSRGSSSASHAKPNVSSNGAGPNQLQPHRTTPPEGNGGHKARARVLGSSVASSTASSGIGSREGREQGSRREVEHTLKRARREEEDQERNRSRDSDLGGKRRVARQGAVHGFPCNANATSKRGGAATSGGKTRGEGSSGHVQGRDAEFGSGDGLLGGIMGSLHSLAGGIVSGRDHEAREAMRGGKEEEERWRIRQRAACDHKAGGGQGPPHVSGSGSSHGNTTGGRSHHGATSSQPRVGGRMRPSWPDQSSKQGSRQFQTEVMQREKGRLHPPGGGEWGKGKERRDSGRVEQGSGGGVMDMILKGMGDTWGKKA
ncbi:unnamed protein product [Discosporangium mesarthrocarpum]